MKIIRFEDGDRLQGESDGEGDAHSRPASNGGIDKIAQQTRKKRHTSTLNMSLFQYIEVYKSYNLHWQSPKVAGKQELFSFAAQPMGSLLKGVFVNQDGTLSSSLSH